MKPAHSFLRKHPFDANDRSAGEPAGHLTAALAGNPQCGGKSTLNFKPVSTGSSQHTGNWAGVTVSCSNGICRSKTGSYTLTDLPAPIP